MEYGCLVLSYYHAKNDKVRSSKSALPVVALDQSLRGGAYPRRDDAKDRHSASACGCLTGAGPVSDAGPDIGEWARGACRRRPGRAERAVRGDAAREQK